MFCQNKSWPIISTKVFTQINPIFSYIRKRRNNHISLIPQHGLDYTGPKVLVKGSTAITGTNARGGWLKSLHFYQQRHQNTRKYIPLRAEIVRSLKVYSTSREECGRCVRDTIYFFGADAFVPNENILK